jgi:hypothetical protein
MYERAALILDSEAHALGDLSLSLIALGLRPLYATQLDELMLLSREHRTQVGALLTPSAELVSRIADLRKGVLEPLGLSASAIVPVGDLGPAPLRDALRGEGLRYCLPSGCQPHELRFVVSRALSDSDPDELRRGARVPCNVPVQVASEHRSLPARFDDVSLGGAFVGLAHPHAAGSRLRLRFTLLEQTSTVTARVAWRTGTNAPAWCDRGMGVEFLDVDGDTCERLRRFVATQLHRFRI